MYIASDQKQHTMAGRRRGSELLVLVDESERSCEYGLLGAEQADESYFDTRRSRANNGGGGGDDDEHEIKNREGRICFPQDRLFGRDKELRQFREYFERLKGQSQVVFLSGYSGSGKTRLVTASVREFSETTGSRPKYIHGKYDEQQTHDPYKGISEAFELWYRHLSKERREELEYVNSELNECVGDDALALASIFPTMAAGLITGNNRNQTHNDVPPSSDPGTEETISKGRLHFAFQCFIKSLCEEDSPVVMFIDDLQFADQCSLDLLLSLLLDSGISNLLFIGVFRSNEVNNDHSLSGMISQVQGSREIHNVHLSELTKESINEFIGETLNLDDADEALSLSPLTEAIFSKTLGNIFFTMQALEQLVRRNALYFDTITFCWRWAMSENQLLSMLSNDIVEMVKSKIECMPDMVQKALLVASYTRSAFNTDTLTELLLRTKLCPDLTQETLVELLDRAVAEGLLVRGAGPATYLFAHDRVQEAAGTLASGEALEDLLFHIGIVLATRGSSQESGEDWMLFTGVHRLNSAPAHYHDDAGRLRLSRLNLETAKLAMEMALYENAAQYAEMGIHFLPADCWESQNTLSCEIHSVAAEAFRLTGDTTKMEKYANTYLKEQKHLPLEEKFAVYFTLANGIFYGSNRSEEAKEIILCLLQSLSCRFPRTSMAVMVQTYSTVLNLMTSKRKRTAEEVEKLGLMTDSKRLKIMKLLNLLFDVCYISKDDVLLPLIVCRALHYTLRYGLSMHSPGLIAFIDVVFFSLNDLQGAALYARYALRLMDKINQRPSKAGTMFASYLLGLCWTIPVKDCVDPLREVHEIGINIGETERASWAISHAIWFEFQAGNNLDNIHSQYAVIVPQFKKLSKKIIVALSLSYWSVAARLIGRSNDLFQMDDMNQDEGQMEFAQLHLEMSDRVERGYYGDYATCADSAIATGNDFIKGPAYPTAALDTCVSALSCLVMARRTGQAKYKKEAKRKHAWVTSWAKQGNPNVQHWKALLDAEKAAIKQRNKVASKKFELAIELSSKAGFIQDTAVALERYGDFSLEALSNRKQADAHYRRSLSLYQQWGACTIVERMKHKCKKAQLEVEFSGETESK